MRKFCVLDGRCLEDAVHRLKDLVAVWACPLRLHKLPSCIPDDVTNATLMSTTPSSCTNQDDLKLSSGLHSL